jgi:hypothetical protein
MRNYKKPSIDLPPRYYDASDYKRWAGRALIASGVLMFLLGWLVAGWIAAGVL